MKHLKEEELLFKMRFYQFGEKMEKLFVCKPVR